MPYATETCPSMERPLRRDGRTLASGDPLIGAQCIACDGVLAEDDEVVNILLGPGGDSTEREAALKPITYTSVCVVIHRACAFGA